MAGGVVLVVVLGRVEGRERGMSVTDAVGEDLARPSWAT